MQNIQNLGGGGDGRINNAGKVKEKLRISIKSNGFPCQLNGIARAVSFSGTSVSGVGSWAVGSGPSSKPRQRRLADSAYHGLINDKETKAKCRHPNKWPCWLYRDFSPLTFSLGHLSPSTVPTYTINMDSRSRSLRSPVYNAQL